MNRDWNDIWLAAPCGLYCGACPIYQAVRRKDAQFLEAAASGIAEMLGHAVNVNELDCSGCLSDTRAIQCRECDLRDCALSRGFNHCAECNEFPCQKFTDFSNDGFPHHSEVLENVRQQQATGINSWIEEQRERWCCPGCGEATDWYSEQCPYCGSMLDEHF